MDKIAKVHQIVDVDVNSIRDSWRIQARARCAILTTTTTTTSTKLAIFRRASFLTATWTRARPGASKISSKFSNFL